MVCFFADVFQTVQQKLINKLPTHDFGTLQNLINFHACMSVNSLPTRSEERKVSGVKLLTHKRTLSLLGVFMLQHFALVKT